MLPKILRMRLDAVERFSVACPAPFLGASVAMKKFSPRRLPGVSGVKIGCARDAKSRESSKGKPQLQRRENLSRSML
jgi:hypothetical protein